MKVRLYGTPNAYGVIKKFEEMPMTLAEYKHNNPNAEIETCYLDSEQRTGDDEQHYYYTDYCKVDGTYMCFPSQTDKNNRAIATWLECGGFIAGHENQITREYELYEAPKSAYNVWLAENKLTDSAENQKEYCKIAIMYAYDINAISGYDMDELSEMFADW